MHRGTFIVILKDENDNLVVWKSREFNGGMGLDNHGKDAFEKLKKVQKLSDFKQMIIDFDKDFFDYRENEMCYKADEKDNPYIDENGNAFYDYVKSNNQFDLFYDTSYSSSSSYYVKNLSNENIPIVCGNGTFVVKPNQIIVTDYDECVNNIKVSFDKEIDKNLGIEDLETINYIESDAEKQILNNIIKTFEDFGYRVDVITRNGVKCGLEIEKWTSGGVDMIESIEFEYFRNLYDIDSIERELIDISDNFSVDEEIDLHREGSDYRRAFTIEESLQDFKEYEKDLEDLAKYFLDKYARVSKENEKNEDIDIVDDMFD